MFPKLEPWNDPTHSMSASDSVGDKILVDLISNNDEIDETSNGFELDRRLKAGKPSAAA